MVELLFFLHVAHFMYIKLIQTLFSLSFFLLVHRKNTRLFHHSKIHTLGTPPLAAS